MNNNDVVKWLGIIVLVAMFGSMIAAAFLYGPTSNNSASDLSNEQLVSTTEEFSYDISFETTALSELSALRLVVKSNSTDKELVDASVSKIEGVNKLSSKFTNLADFNGWFYYAEIYLKKGSNASLVAKNILALEHFSQDAQDSQVVKYMTVKTPEQVKLTNTDLNISRDYNFEITTVSALVDTNTNPKDELMVSGTIKLIGNAISYLELMEQINLTKYYESMSDLNLENEITINEDLNSIEEDLNTTSNDENSTNEIFIDLNN